MKNKNKKCCCVVNVKNLIKIKKCCCNVVKKVRSGSGSNDQY
jgi:hypothetical protein